MEKNKYALVAIILLLSIILTSCTGSGTQINSWSGAIIKEDSLYYVNAGKVYALDSENGNIIWEYPDKASASRVFMAAPALAGEQLLVGDYANLLTSLDKKNGNENWQFKGANGRYIDSPLIIKNIIVAPNSDNHIYALDFTGNLKWEFEAKHSFWAQPTTDGKVVFAPSMDHNLYALDLTTGHLIWKVDLNAALVARSTLVDGILFIGNLNGDLYAINSINGEIIWHQKMKGGIWSAPTMVNNHLFLGDQSGNVNIIKSENGSIIKSIQTSSAVIGSGVILSNGVVFGNKKGVLTLFGFNGQKIWSKTIDGSLYSNLLLLGDQIFVIATKGEKPIVVVDKNGNENKLFNFIIKK